MEAKQRTDKMNQQAIDFLSQAANSMSGGTSATQRAQVAQSVGVILDDDLSVQERMIALEIIEALANDKVDEVRRMVAAKVADSAFLPLAIARKLAIDIESVSLPVLELSPVLTDEILLDVVASGLPQKVGAIAQRSRVSSSVSAAIVETGQVGPIALLLRNRGAEISERTFSRALENHGRNPAVGKAVVARGEVPPKILKVIDTLVEAHVVAYVQRHFNLPEEVVRPKPDTTSKPSQRLGILKSKTETKPKATSVTW